MIFKLSFKNVFRNKRRTAITVAVVAVGVSMLILALSYVEFIKWGLAESFIHGQTGHFQIMTKNFLTQDEERILEFGIKEWKDQVQKIEGINGVEVVTPRINFSGLASTGEKSNGIMASAVDPRKEIVLGAGFIDPDPLTKLIHHDDGILLARGLAGLLNARTGDYITLMTTTADGALNAYDFEMVGTIGVFSEELDKRYAVITLEGAKVLLATDKVERILVGLRNTDDLPVVVEQASSLIYPGLKIKLWNEISKYYDKVLGFFYQLIGFLAPVLMLIVWFSTMNTVLMSILERSAELACLRAMGTSKFTLVRMLFTEGVWLGIIGVAIGIILELVLSFLINHAEIMVPPPPGQTSGYSLQVRNVWGSFMFVGVLTIGVVSISTIFPAIRIVKLNIVKALRRQ